MTSDQPLSPEQIFAALEKVNARTFGQPLHYHPQVGSTNDIARHLAGDGAPEGTLVIADLQTAGRGRLSRQWFAPANSALLMSILFRPTLPASDVYRLVMVCGLAIAEACEAACEQSVGIKWPNDLLIRDKKFCGILPESSLTGEQIDWVVVGMGVNVNMKFPPADPLSQTATSLHTVYNASLDRTELLAQILLKIEQRYQQVSDSVLEQHWNDRCVNLGKRVQASTASGQIVGVGEEIDRTGALWLRLENGTRQRLTISEASLHSGSE